MPNRKSFTQSPNLVSSEIVAITDDSTGTASDTIAVISDTATKNAIATLAAKQNQITAALAKIGIIEA